MRKDDLTSESEIRRRHRELLDTLRELLRDFEHSADGTDTESLRALLAFLRHGVLAFAHGEERTAGENEDGWESIEFEHAFIEAEIERLVREARPLLTPGRADRPTGPPRSSWMTSAPRVSGTESGMTRSTVPSTVNAGDVGVIPLGPRSARAAAVIASRADIPAESAHSLARVRRRLYRIEAALEMHVIRDAERAPAGYIEVRRMYRR